MVLFFFSWILHACKSDVLFDEPLRLSKSAAFFPILSIILVALQPGSPGTLFFACVFLASTCPAES